MPDTALDRFAPFCARPISEIERDLRSYVSLLLKWNKVTNLVSRETEGMLWNRHILDSLQLLPLIPGKAQRILDLGSGGGLPAIPLAIAFKGGDRSITLVEPIQKKVSFLRTVIRELELPATVIAGRIESADSRETPDVITSRALASLDHLFQLSERFFGPETLGLFHKGGEHLKELAESRSAWAFDVVVNPSSTDLSGAIVQISSLRSVNTP